MTGPAAIAILTGLAAAHLITHHQHRSTTPHQPQPTRRTETGHGHQDRPQDQHGEEDRGEDDGHQPDHPGEEDHPRPEDAR